MDWDRLVSVIRTLNELPRAEEIVIGSTPPNFIAETMYAVGWLETFADRLEAR